MRHLRQQQFRWADPELASARPRLAQGIGGQSPLVHAPRATTWNLTGRRAGEEVGCRQGVQRPTEESHRRFAHCLPGDAPCLTVGCPPTHPVRWEELIVCQFGNPERPRAEVPAPTAQPQLEDGEHHVFLFPWVVDVGLGCRVAGAHVDRPQGVVLGHDVQVAQGCQTDVDEALQPLMGVVEVQLAGVQKMLGEADRSILVVGDTAPTSSRGGVGHHCDHRLWVHAEPCTHLLGL